MAQGREGARAQDLCLAWASVPCARGPPCWSVDLERLSLPECSDQHLINGVSMKSGEWEIIFSLSSKTQRRSYSPGCTPWCNWLGTSPSESGVQPYPGITSLAGPHQSLQSGGQACHQGRRQWELTGWELLTHLGSWDPEAGLLFPAFGSLLPLWRSFRIPKALANVIFLRLRLQLSSEIVREAS